MSTDAQGILISPVEFKRLGKTSPALTSIEKFGGAQQGNAQTTTNLEALQDNFDNGFSPNLEKTTIDIKDENGDIIGSAIVDLPRGRELGGLFFTLSSAVRSLQQNPLDFVSKQTYTTNALVKQYQTNALYYSAVDNNTGADLSASLYSNATSYDIDVFVKSTEGHIYKSLASSNLNNPLTDNTKWQKVWHFIINFTRWEDINTYLTTFNTAEKLVKTDTGNKILNTLLNTATESTAGILPLANNTEALAGTNDTKAMTPLKVQQKIDSLGGLNYNYNDFPLTAFNTITNLTFNAGKYLNSSNAIITAPAINKLISGSFVAGNNANGLFPSVSLTANSWLYCFRIRNTTSGDVEAGFDNNINATNIPSGYDSPKFVGAIRINASSQIGSFAAYRVGTTCRTFFDDFVVNVLSGSGLTRTINSGFNTALISPMVQATGTNSGGILSVNMYNSDYTLAITHGLSRSGSNTAPYASVNGFSYTVQTNASGAFVVNISAGTISTVEIFGFEFNL